ncbi:nucleotidyl transferase AbiEii/AbiGii toxin family protein [Patescibacteria group bacterium]|nr:nucleotidyl transferase AbiEii/AbiGii toxin family protein [Patescibacteria group bacterium]
MSRKQLALLNRQKLKYPLAIAEKDYFLTLVSKIIYDSPLREKLIFKGGTALHHVYLPQLRFSEDLDFSSNKESIELEDAREIFKNYDFLKIKKDYISGATIKLEKLQYVGPLGQANSLKVEIDFLQNVVLLPLELNYENVYGVRTKVRAMDIREIAAEKVRAMNDRVRYRDFYDFTMIFLKLNLDLEEVIELVKRKEIRKNISLKSILSNWELAKKDKINELSAIYFAEELADEQIFEQLKKLDFAEIKKEKTQNREF